MTPRLTWCSQCGPNVAIGEDGCCELCGADAVGPGADVAHVCLEACRVALAELCGRHGQHDDNPLPTLLRAAIAKAEVKP